MIGVSMIKLTHIHPMFVHFPIVLFIVAVALTCYAQVKNENIAARNCLGGAIVASYAAAAVFSWIAAFFGDIALDAAVNAGFAKDPLETHESLAGTAIVLLTVLSIVTLYSWWKHIDLGGMRGRIFTIVALLTLILLLITAYFGGNLVYELGVNVKGVVP